MTCTYFEYREMMEKMFYGKPLTDTYLNNITERIRQYLISGGAEEVVSALGIGIKTITKSATLLPEETIYKRFVWLSGDREGKELYRSEIEGIGLFLKHGALYGKCGIPAL